MPSLAVSLRRPESSPRPVDARDEINLHIERFHTIFAHTLTCALRPRWRGALAASLLAPAARLDAVRPGVDLLAHAGRLLWSLRPGLHGATGATLATLRRLRLRAPLPWAALAALPAILSTPDGALDVLRLLTVGPDASERPSLAQVAARIARGQLAEAHALALALRDPRRQEALGRVAAALHRDDERGSMRIVRSLRHAGARRQALLAVALGSLDDERSDPLAHLQALPAPARAWAAVALADALRRRGRRDEARAVLAGPVGARREAVMVRAELALDAGDLGTVEALLASLPATSLQPRRRVLDGQPWSAWPGQDGPSLADRALALRLALAAQGGAPALLTAWSSAPPVARHRLGAHPSSRRQLARWLPSAVVAALTPRDGLVEHEDLTALLLIEQAAQLLDATAHLGPDEPSTTALPAPSPDPRDDAQTEAPYGTLPRDARPDAAPEPSPMRSESWWERLHARLQKPPRTVALDQIDRWCAQLSPGHADELASALRAGAPPVDMPRPVSLDADGRAGLMLLDRRRDQRAHLRFADSMRSCFHSSSRTYWSTLDTQRQVLDLWLDPMSFVFLVVRSRAGSATMDEALGFVFGSFGLSEGQGGLLLNGVYLRPSAIGLRLAIIEAIEQRLARALGLRWVAIASRHGGRGPLPAAYAPAARTVRRLRALRGADGHLLRTILDDIAVGVNAECSSPAHLHWRALSRPRPGTPAQRDR